MNDFPFAAIGFDLDGTLLDTHRDLGAAVNHALALGGYEPVPITDIESLIGGGAKQMLHAAMAERGGTNEAEFRQLYKALLAYYAKNNAVHTRPYPDVVAVLDELAAMGVTMAVVTNKFESFAVDILGKLDLAHYFVTIIGGDTMGKGADGKQRAKPAPDPIVAARERCGVVGNGGGFAFVGDSSYDVAAAKAAGVPVLAAAYGYCDKPAAELGADGIVERFADLIPALRGIS